VPDLAFFSTPAVLSVDAPVCFFDGLAGLDRWLG
jgi:hypothetical protein